MRTYKLQLIRFNLLLLGVLVILVTLTAALFNFQVQASGGAQNAPAEVEAQPAKVVNPRPQAASVTIDLCASNGTITLPDSTSVAVWGFVDTGGGSCTTGLANSLPGPEIRVDAGDIVTINLTNALAVNTSILIPGQNVTGSGDVAGLFAAEAAASGGSATYVFTAQEGTYLYESGTNNSIQIPMGLYGALVVDPIAGPSQAYGYAYDQEAVLLLSEIDPNLNGNPGGFDLLDYHPTYWLINGAAYPDTAPITASPGDQVLLRYLNAGFDHLSMALLGGYQTVIAKEAFELNNSFDAVAETVPAGTTADMIVDTTDMEEGAYPLYNRNMYVTNANVYPGGMLTLIELGPLTPFYGVSIAPVSDAQSGDLGEVVSYTLDVTNDGNVSDTFDVMVTGNSWTTSAPATVGPILAGGTAQITVDVTIPLGANDGDMDTATVTATSQGDNLESASSDLTTTAMVPVYAVSVAPATDGQSGAPGEMVSYMLDVTNDGNVTDTFNITVGGNSWSTSAPATIGPLTAGATAQITVDVTVPGGAGNGATDTATVTATSQGNNAESASSDLTTTAVVVYGVSVAPATDAQSGSPGEMVSYTLDVTNDGNVPDTFDVDVTGNLWPTLAPATVGPLAVGETAQITVDVTVPGGAGNGAIDTATVTATSQGNNAESASSDLTTTAVFGSHIGDLDGSTTPGGGPNWTAVVTVTVHNASENPLANATVTFEAIRTRKSNGNATLSTLSCVTNASGQCNVSQSVNSNQFENTVTFTVNNISDTVPYQSGDNHDPDEDSDGTAIVVQGP